jgi:DNA repair exonuclease SbcCD nuclease subunit
MEMKYIITADIHARKDVPLCRSETEDEWLETQRKVLDFIVDVANKHKADILIAGDLTDTPRVPNEIMFMFFQSMSRLNGKCLTIAGNHSLSYRREANVGISSVGLIKALNSDKLVYCDCDEHIENTRFEHSHRLNDEITMVHTLTFKKEEDIPFAVEAMTAQDLLDKYDTKYIAVGDMHKPFVYENKGRFVINPGKALVETVSEMDKPPVCYLLDTDTGEITEILLPHDPTKVSNEHITKKKEYDESLESAIKLLQEVGDDTTLDYVANLMIYCDKNKASLGARDIINEIREEKQ